MATDPAARPTARALLRVMESPGSRPPVPTRPSPAPTQAQSGDAGTTWAADTPPADTAVGPPTRVRASGPRPGRRTAVRWLTGLSAMAAAAAVGAVAGLFVTIVVVTALVLVAIGLRLARENQPEDARPAMPTWGVAVAAPVALGVGVAQLIGPLGGAGVVLGLIVLFVILGGDIG
jgi:hypothetical protein